MWCATLTEISLILLSMCRVVVSRHVSLMTSTRPQFKSEAGQEVSQRPATKQIDYINIGLPAGVCTFPRRQSPNGWCVNGTQAGKPLFTVTALISPTHHWHYSQPASCSNQHPTFSLGSFNGEKHYNENATGVTQTRCSICGLFGNNYILTSVVVFLFRGVIIQVCFWRNG